MVTPTSQLHEIALNAGRRPSCEGKAVCWCGHARAPYHASGLCTACNCIRYQQAEDEQRAILAGMSRKRAAVDAANEARRRHLEAVAL